MPQREIDGTPGSGFAGIWFGDVLTFANPPFRHRTPKGWGTRRGESQRDLGRWLS